MLELDQVDLRELADALEDHSDWHSWWLDPHSGTVELWSDDAVEDEGDHPLDRGWIGIEPIESQQAYADMVEFIDAVVDPRARDLLTRAVEGRGAFRRFKDTLIEFPDLRETWFGFHAVRMEHRAIEWLLSEGLVDEIEAKRAIAERPDTELPRARNPRAIACAVAEDLAALYGPRLRDVRLYGSWARGDAHPESDIDLLIVLDAISSRWSERRRIADILWRHSFENDVVVSAHPVSEEELQQRKSPFLARIGAEATTLA
jgi:predicted nucleotidyltransferase